MEFNEYQKWALETAYIYRDRAKAVAGNSEAGTLLRRMYPALKLNGEAGELAEKIGKYFRDNIGDGDGITDEGTEEWNRFRGSVVQELGDCLWYIAAVAEEFGCRLEDVARSNIAKLQSRRERGKLHGSGDER